MRSKGPEFRGSYDDLDERYHPANLLKASGPGEKEAGESPIALVGTLVFMILVLGLLWKFSRPV